MLHLTEQAHEIVGGVVRPGDIAIDATAGNGHDTLRLAQLVGETGTVHAIDIQLAALDETRARIAAAGYRHVVFHQRSHAELPEILPASDRGRVAAVMFNLGYLPGSDKSLTTAPATTTAALHAALDSLRPGGVVTVLAYIGHPGGSEEAQAVEDLLSSINPAELECRRIMAAQNPDRAPRLYAVFRRI